MFKLNYKQLLSLPVAFVRYGNRTWLCQKIFIWILPSVTRDSAFGLFVLSFCLIKHRSSHYLILYAIISFSIYNSWVKFLQLKYTEPLYGRLQGKFDLAFDIRHLYRVVAVSPYLLGFFSHICTIGLYLLYAGKSILISAEQTAVATKALATATAQELVSNEAVQGLLQTGASVTTIEMSVADPVIAAAAKFVGVEVGSFKALLALKGFAPWFESVKNSSAGFFPISMTSLLHLQCVKDPEIAEPLYQAFSRAPELFFYAPYAVQSASNYWVSPVVKLWSDYYQAYCKGLAYGMPGKYISFAYMFAHNGGAPFFGHFRNDLELMKLLGNFSSETFSLFQFFGFSFRTAFRLWIPIFPLGYKDWLAWWIHPYSEISLINLIGQSRYIFEPFMIAVSLVLDNSIQQLYASYYMDRWFFPLFHFLNQWNKLRPATVLETRDAFFNPVDSVSEEVFKPSKFSKFILNLTGYTVKYAAIYVPCEQARIRTQLYILELIIIGPFILAFKILTVSFRVFVWLLYDSFIHFSPEVVFNPFTTEVISHLF